MTTPAPVGVSDGGRRRSVGSGRKSVGGPPDGSAAGSQPGLRLRAALRLTTSGCAGRDHVACRNPAGRHGAETRDDVDCRDLDCRPREPDDRFNHPVAVRLGLRLFPQSRVHHAPLASAARGSTLVRTIRQPGGPIGHWTRTLVGTSTPSDCAVTVTNPGLSCVSNAPVVLSVNLRTLSGGLPAQPHRMRHRSRSCRHLAYSADKRLLSRTLPLPGGVLYTVHGAETVQLHRPGICRTFAETSH